MKGITKDQALEQIFSKVPLDKNERLWKHRYKVGKLSKNTIDDLLEYNGYIVSQELLYIKNV